MERQKSLEKPQLSTLLVQSNMVHQQEHSIGPDLTSALVFQKAFNFSGPASRHSHLHMKTAPMHALKNEQKHLKTLLNTNLKHYSGRCITSFWFRLSALQLKYDTAISQDTSEKVTHNL